jgi:aminoglycoside N3'-acetyltransferase
VEATYVGRTDVLAAIDELDIAGRPICLHASLSAHGAVVGGAATIVDALLERGVTVVVPTFSGAAFEVPAPPVLAQDGAAQGAATIFSPESLEIDASMGALPREVLAHLGRQRGNHPVNSFTAIGPLAEDLVREQTATDVYSPLRAVGERDGTVVLAGVGLNRMTLIHVAEAGAGRRLFRCWARMPGGEIMPTVAGGCSEGFFAFEPVLAPIERSTGVGSARWRAFPVAGVLELATAAIRADPEITRCADPSCKRCPVACAGIGRRPG